MKRPEKRGRQRERQAVPSEARGEHRTRQRPAHDAKEREGGKDQDEEVQRVVAPDVGAAQRVVHRKRKVRDRAAAHRRLPRRGQSASQGGHRCLIEGFSGIAFRSS